MAALYAGLHGAADAFAIAIKCRNEKSDLIHLKSSGYAAMRISLRPIDLHQRSKLAERDKGPEKPLLRKPHWGDSRDGHQDLSCGSDRGHRSPAGQLFSAAALMAGDSTFATAWKKLGGQWRN